MAPEANVAGKSAEVEAGEPTAAELVPRLSAISTEAILAAVLADIVHAEQVSVDSNFFDDLGADSMVMARFCARARKRGDLPSVSMKDIYGHPTIRSLAAAIADGGPAQAESSAAESSAAETIEAAAPVSTLLYLSCGLLQLLSFLGYIYLAAFVGARAYEWISASSGYLDIYVRAVLLGAAVFTVLCIFPIPAKWLLIGRWKRQHIRIWSLLYVRFWIVKTLVRSSPMAVLFAGTPLYVLYLRALGAKIGRRVVIFSHHVPVCTDLLTIGDDTVVRKDSFFACYRAHSGWIQTGPVTLGSGVFIGEKTVLDIDSSMGDGSQIGHASALYSGQTVPAGARWHGSPGRRTDLNYLRVEPAPCGILRRITFNALTLLSLFFVYLPLLEGSLYLLLTRTPSAGKVLNPSTGGITSGSLYLDSLAISLVLFFGATIIGLIGVLTVPRLLNLLIEPDKVYPLYGFHDRIHRAITRMTGIKFFTHLFGDSSYIVYYLRSLGYDLSRIEQTGSNFGTEVGHETPFLSSIGTGTMVADGLSIMNADFSNSSFRVSRVSIGPRNFVGNNIAYPAGGRTGENCLLATKVMIPLDGNIREGIGLLGSPSFEIPRSVERDSRFDSLATGPALQRSLAMKNRYNLRTMAMFLVSRWLHLFIITVLGLAAFDYLRGYADLVMAVFLALAVLVTPVYFVLLERGLKAFRLLEPRYCSIYDPYFWRHERLWKVPGETYLNVFDGTPVKNLIWRGLGVRIGRRVFDDGCYLTERTLVSIGDDCVLNAGTKIQCHSQEDGTFKSDRSAIGAGCTLGVGAMVHYGVTMADGSELAPDSFLMKGEEVPVHACWGGNPARER
jgi:non-ribosomal peptide synthetase-like protein